MRGRGVAGVGDRAYRKQPGAWFVLPATGTRRRCTRREAGRLPPGRDSLGTTTNPPPRQYPARALLTPALGTLLTLTSPCSLLYLLDKPQPACPRRPSATSLWATASCGPAACSRCAASRCEAAGGAGAGVTALGAGAGAGCRGWGQGQGLKAGAGQGQGLKGGQGAGDRGRRWEQGQGQGLEAGAESGGRAGACGRGARWSGVGGMQHCEGRAPHPHKFPALFLSRSWARTLHSWTRATCWW